MLHVMIIDDEEWAIKRLVRLLCETDWIKIVGTFQHPQEAYEYARSNRVDIAFLDISMPHINGMRLSSLLTELNVEIGIVFVTGYEQYAVQAFEMSALDYLMKPVDEDRLGKTLAKIKKLRRVTVTTPTPTPEISVYLFNGCKIYSGGDKKVPLKLRSPKTEELFAYIACKGTVSRDEIIDVLWPSLDSEKAMNNVNTHLYYIRRALGNDACIEVSRSEIRIVSNRVYCDLYEFDEIVKQVRKDENPNLSWIDKAESLYVGPLLHGRTYGWKDELANYCELAYIGLLDIAARVSIAGDQQYTALRYYDEILKLDRLREDVYNDAIRLCIQMGRKGEAIIYYRVLESMLQAEFGTSPDPAVTSLIQNMM